MRILVYIAIAFLCSRCADAVIGPCIAQSIGGACQLDNDCAGLNVECQNNTCVCGDLFQHRELQGGVIACEPAPDTIGATCTTNCKPPLLCIDSTCQCLRPTRVEAQKCYVDCPAGQVLRGHNCVKGAHLNEQCNSDQDCIDPMTSCVGKVCKCLTGTTYDANRRACTAKCPDGVVPGRSCKKLFKGQGQILERSDKTDNCPVGQYCVAFGEPAVGVCCPLKCPYGVPLTGRSCEPNALTGTRCEDDSYYCYRLQGPQASNALCCPRPCKEPMPLYIDGKCWPRAFLGDTCVHYEQCDGGSSMQCINGRCMCKSGYQAASNVKFPTCTKTCPLNTIMVGEDCKPMATYGQSCQSSAQCGSELICKQSTCQCPCGKGWKNGRCVTLQVLANTPVDFDSWAAKIREFITG